MMPAWFQRLNSRERVLSMIIAGALFLLVNYIIWNSILGMIGRARTDLASRASVRKQQEVFLKEAKMWKERDAWLQKFQPTLQNPAEASTLLTQMKEVASKHKVLLENPQIGSGESTPNYQSVFASIESKSPWPPLVHFLYDVQKPESFVVFESVNLAIDSADPTMMRGKFKIARWFAPKGGQTR